MFRFIKQKLGIEKCTYKSDLKMIKSMYKWTNDYEENRYEFEKKLKKYQDKLIVLSSFKEIDKYILYKE